MDKYKNEKHSNLFNKIKYKGIHTQILIAALKREKKRVWDGGSQSDRSMFIQARNRRIGQLRHELKEVENEIRTLKMDMKKVQHV